MNNLKENANKLLPLLQAILDGKIVQYRCPDEQNGWEDADNWSLLVTDFTEYEYRVKPDPVLDFADELMRDLNCVFKTAYYKDDLLYAKGFEHAFSIVKGSRARILNKGV